MEGLRGRGGGNGTTQASSDLQESTAMQNSAVSIIGVNKIAPKFVTLVATYIYMSFGILKTSQRDGYIYVVRRLKVNDSVKCLSTALCCL